MRVNTRLLFVGLLTVLTVGPFAQATAAPAKPKSLSVRFVMSVPFPAQGAPGTFASGTATGKSCANGTLKNFQFAEMHGDDPTRNFGGVIKCKGGSLRVKAHLAYNGDRVSGAWIKFRGGTGIFSGYKDGSSKGKVSGSVSRGQLVLTGTLKR